MQIESSFFMVREEKMLGRRLCHNRFKLEKYLRVSTASNDAATQIWALSNTPLPFCFSCCLVFA